MRLQIEPAGSKDTGPCECCGHESRRVWGFASDAERGVAAYFVHWTLGRVPDHGASFDLVVGDWQEGTAAEDRSAVSLAYRLTEEGPQFIVVDATGRLQSPGLAERELRRDEVIGRPVAELAFAVVDAILEHDDRVAELLGPHRISRPPAPPAKRPWWRPW